MNWVDIVIVILVLGLGILGWRKGVISIVFTLVGGIVGLILAGRLFDDLAPAIPIGNKEGVQQLIAFAIIVLVVMILAWIGARIVKGVLTILLLGWVDGLAGAVIGLVLGGIAATAFVSAAGIVPSDTVQEAVDESSIAEPLVDNMGFVFTLLPSEFDDVKDLLDQGGNLLERSGELQDLIDQADGLLGSGSEFTFEWTNAEDFAGDNIFAVFEPRTDSGVAFGPLRMRIGDDGVALLEVPDGIDGGTTYDIYYFVDVNDNGVCDEEGSDVKRQQTLQPGVVEISTSTLSFDIAADGVCAHLE
jgi:membrane protein required for colicin V production